jgi:hypothetical protein
MSQQPDQLPRSYWQFDEGGEPDAKAGRGVPPLGGAPAILSTIGDHTGGRRAWETPVASSLPTGSHQRGSPHSPLHPLSRRKRSLLKILLVLLFAVVLAVAGSVSGAQVRGTIDHGGVALASPTVPPQPARAATPTAHPSASLSSSATVVVPSPAPQDVVLAQDNFQRRNQPFWGDASDGSVWGADANTSSAFSIVAGTGRVTGGKGFFTAILGLRRASSEVVCAGSVSHFDGSRNNLGAVLRWTDNNHFYKAYFDGAGLILVKKSAGVSTELAAVPFAAHDGVNYSLRFRAWGTQLLVRAWPSAEPEPGRWMIQVVDSTLTTGFGGLRALLETGITVTVTRFRETSATAP